jgi:hypothetical protein
LKKIETFIVILKLRFSEDETKKSGSSSKNAGKPKGKASKKRALANKLAEAEAVYDNDEERLLFEVCFFGQCFVYNHVRFRGRTAMFLISSTQFILMLRKRANSILSSGMESFINHIAAFVY